MQMYPESDKINNTADVSFCSEEFEHESGVTMYGNCPYYGEAKYCDKCWECIFSAEGLH